MTAPLTPEIPTALQNSWNREVLSYLSDKSAHSDIAEMLGRAVEALGDAQLFCPDAKAYRYVLASTRGIVFGFAVGMHHLVFRLDESMRPRALATGAILFPDCGPGWVAVVHPRNDSDWPAVDTVFWARKAYVHARQCADQSGAGERRR